MKVRQYMLVNIHAPSIKFKFQSILFLSVLNVAHTCNYVQPDVLVNANEVQEEQRSSNISCNSLLIASQTDLWPGDVVSKNMQVSSPW